MLDAGVGKYAGIVAVMLISVFGSFFMLELADACGKLIRRWLDPKLLVREPLSPPCDHSWSVEHVTYSPPRDNVWLFQLEPGDPRERAMHGCTSIMRRCEHCKRAEVQVLLGKHIPAPPAWADMRRNSSN